MLVRVEIYRVFGFWYQSAMKPLVIILLAPCCGYSAPLSRLTRHGG